MLDNLDLLGTIPLIDAVVPEALADRVNNIYRLISQKADAKKKLSTASQYAAELQEDDESILLHGHRREVFGCAWHPSCNIVATGYLEFISTKITGASANVTLCEVTACTKNPCLHNGVCSELSDGGYECRCKTEWTGRNCAEDINECQLASMCNNRGPLLK